MGQEKAIPLAYKTFIGTRVWGVNVSYFLKSDAVPDQSHRIGIVRLARSVRGANP